MVKEARQPCNFKLHLGHQLLEISNICNENFHHAKGNQDYFLELFFDLYFIIDISFILKQGK